MAVAASGLGVETRQALSESAAAEGGFLQRSVQLAGELAAPVAAEPGGVSRQDTAEPFWRGAGGDSFSWGQFNWPLIVILGLSWELWIRDRDCGRILNSAFSV